MRYTYEILFGKPSLSVDEWQRFCRQLSRYLGAVSHYQIILQYENWTISYFLLVNQTLPPSLGLADFLLRRIDNDFTIPESHSANLALFRYFSGDFCLILHKLERKRAHLRFLICDFQNFLTITKTATQICYRKHDKLMSSRLSCYNPAYILSIDFSKNHFLHYQKIPAYLPVGKIQKLLSDKIEDALFCAELFPYGNQAQYVAINNYDFAAHSLVLGSSGAGKSHFLAHFLTQLSQLDSRNYKVLVLDPHDDLYRQCGEIAAQKVLNFQTTENSIDLFRFTSQSLSAEVELLLELFQSLLAADYNNRLARVLRYACILLLATQQFTFRDLRQLLTDANYRNQLLQNDQIKASPYVISFFLTDFTDLKTKHYNEAIAPIISLLDELQFAPVFNCAEPLPSLLDSIQKNFLNIISLNRFQLSAKITQTIAGLVLQQLFLLAQQSVLSEQLIIVIDEAATIKSPLLARFLSELRKFGVAVILAGQYLQQFDLQLLQSIFTNVRNFYLFRCAPSDADLLVQNLKIKTAHAIGSPDDLLTKLNPRECLLKLTVDQKSQPIFKAKTTDFTPRTATTVTNISQTTQISFASLMQNQIRHTTGVWFALSNASMPMNYFSTASAPSVQEVLHTQSTNRRKINLELKK